MTPTQPQAADRPAATHRPQAHGLQLTHHLSGPHHPSGPHQPSGPRRACVLTVARDHRRQALAGWSLLVMACVLWLLAAPALARAGALPGEQPGFVGRLSTLQGEVRWYDRDSAAWLGSTQQALRNWPLATGDRLRTGPDARAELRLGGTTVRLGADVDLTLQQLDENRLELLLQSGTLALRLPGTVAGDVAAVEVITPEGRWLPLRPGHYRLERQTEARTPATQATVWRGELRFEGADSVLLIPAGRRADLWQDRGRGPTRYAWAAVERDAFADWVARDERGDDAPVTARHVPPGMTGWQDLDRHGDWVDSPEYGNVWQPRVVAPGWAPFHDGRWAWVSPWGWTWIDAAPWGFAPFHYGNWVMSSGRWGWSPGPRHVRPRYAPVHPGWVSGPQIHIGIQIGGGHRPPPPRVVIPVAPRPPVVVLPRPPHGHGHGHPPPLVGPVPQPRPGDRHDGRRVDERDEHRHDADRGHPGWQPWHDHGERGDRHERRERGDRGDRGERGERGERVARGDRGPASDRPDRHHWAERVDRSPPPPQGPATPLAPALQLSPAAAPALPVKPAASPGPRADAPRTAVPQIDPPHPATPPRPDGPARPERPDRPQRPDTSDRADRADRPVRPERSDASVRPQRNDAQAWR